MILLHNKDHKQNNPLATFATPSAGKGRDMSELQAQLITAWHYNCEPDSCAVWVSYRQKTVIARTKSINRNL